MDTDKNGKVSKQEFMSVMEAEFNRLDVNHDGALDVHELTQLQVRPSSGYHRGITIFSQTELDRTLWLSQSPDWSTHRRLYPTGSFWGGQSRFERSGSTAVAGGQGNVLPEVTVSKRLRE
jgi:hypothetical protein